MLTKGIYIAVHLDSNGNPYVEDCGMNMSICTTNDFVDQEKEARNFMIRHGASQVYWFKKYPVQLDNPRTNKTAYIQNHGMLVCSDKKEEVA